MTTRTVEAAKIEEGREMDRRRETEGYRVRKQSEQEFDRLIKIRNAAYNRNAAAELAAAQAALEEHMKATDVWRLGEIVSETRVRRDGCGRITDARFDTPAMKRYLRRFSLGPGKMRTESGGISVSKYMYRRAHVEAAWLALSEKKRIARCRQNYHLLNLLSADENSLLPTKPYGAQEIEEALRLWPLTEDTLAG